jgi:hypothetical protein
MNEGLPPLEANIAEYDVLDFNNQFSKDNEGWYEDLPPDFALLGMGTEPQTLDEAL